MLNSSVSAQMYRIDDRTKFEKLMNGQLTQVEILLVSSDEMLRETITMCLKKKGFDTITTFNAEEALELLEHFPYSFRVLITDNLMDKMNGIELIKEIKKRGYEFKKFVITSSMIGFELEIQKLKEIDERLTTLLKPFKPEELYRSIE